MYYWLFKKWTQLKCKHRYEVYDEYQRFFYNPQYGQSTTHMYKLYCPYCDKESFESADAYEKRKMDEVAKAEIKRKVLGGISDD